MGEFAVFSYMKPVAKVTEEKGIRAAFRGTVLVKGFHSLIEIIGGVALYALGNDRIVRWLDQVGGHRLSQDPGDWLAVRLLSFASVFSAEGSFYAFYLLSHGIVNMALVIGLWRERLWSYPATFVVLGLFIAYQLYRFTYTHDPGLIVITTIDLIVIALAWHEYRRIRRGEPTH